MTDSKELPQRMTKVDRRSGKDRRQLFYTAYIPERRSGKDRRNIGSTASSCLSNIEDNGTMKRKKSA